MSRTKVMVSISDDFLNEIDEVAKEENRSRSELLREAVRLYLKVKKSHTTRGQNPVVQKAIAIQDMIAQQDTAVDWDSTAEIRKWRDRNEV